MKKKHEGFFYGFPAKTVYIAEASKETVIIDFTYKVTFHKRNYRRKSDKLVREILEQFYLTKDKLVDKKCFVTLEAHWPYRHKK